MSLTLNIEGPSHSPSGTTDDHWLQSLMTERMERDEGSNLLMGPVIPRVPAAFREMKENTRCYEPRVVSIGPYHHGKKELEEMEKLKTRFACQFVKDESVNAEEMYRKVKELVGEARRCYAYEFTHQFSDEKFSQMMFLDGCFILQFLSKKYEKYKLRHEDVALVTRDLFLLENQLPFQVLISMMRLSFRSEQYNLNEMFEHYFEHIRAIPPHRESCREKISNLFLKLPRVLISRSKSPSEDIHYGNVNHLLELFYIRFINSGRHYDWKMRWHRETTWNRYHSVSELKDVGIHFKPSSTSKFTHVQFKPTLLGGALYVPPLSIDDSTKPLLLNLAAYEECAGHYSGHLTSYICFMRSLIDQPEDVKELRSQGILRNTLGSDDQIAQQFKEMTTNLVPNPYAFMKVKRAIESHYRNTFKRWILYYWAPVSTAVVKYSFIYGFLISAIQAYLSATKEKPGLGNCSCPNATKLHP